MNPSIGIRPAELQALIGCFESPNPSDGPSAPLPDIMNLWRLDAEGGIEGLNLRESFRDAGREPATYGNYEGMADNFERIATIEPLAVMKDLRRLSLEGTRTLNLAPLAKLTRLEDLDLTYLDNPIEQDDKSEAGGAVGHSEISLVPLFALSSLRILRLEGTREIRFDEVLKLRGLTQLSISGPKISTLDGISALAALEAISVTDSAVQDLTPLTRCSALARVRLEFHRITDFAPLLELPKLRQVVRGHQRLTAESEAVFAELKNRGVKVFVRSAQVGLAGHSVHATDEEEECIPSVVAPFPFKPIRKAAPYLKW